MAIKLRNKRLDPPFKKIVKALEEYQAKHAEAEIDIYRQNNVSVRIRVIDPGFKGKTRAEREEEIWSLIEKLPEEVAAEISMLLLGNGRVFRQHGI